MGATIDLSSRRRLRQKAKEIKMLDASASYVVLEECLKMLNLNNLEELKDIKKHIKKTLKKLSEIESA